MLRSIGAVFAGLLAIFVLSIAADLVMHSTGVFPPAGEPMADSRWWLAIAYRFVFGIVGCYLAARLAPSQPMRHAWILGGIGIAIGLAGALATWNQGPGFGPKWYALTVAAMPIPCAWIGGWLGAGARQRRAPVV